MSEETPTGQKRNHDDRGIIDGVDVNLMPEAEAVWRAVDFREPGPINDTDHDLSVEEDRP